MLQGGLVALNAWWNADPAQRYWMEVATEHMGDALQAPQGQGVWSYDLVGEVRPGDRVLHWQGGPGEVRALAGWSEVVAAPRTVPQYSWRPRGTAGRALTGARTTPGWVVDLGGLNVFTRPATAALLQPRRWDLMKVNSALEAVHGKPTYFPFYLYGNGTELRAQQAYFLKFPVELFDVIPGITDARLHAPGGDAAKSESAVDSAEEVEEAAETLGTRAGSGRVTRIQDPKLRAAIERRSLEVATEHYIGLGARREDIEELGKPYDLVVQLDGVERHVEVKGSSLLVDTVELTINEVLHARSCRNADLVVVDAIAWSRDETGEVVATGGKLRFWKSWTPAAGALRETKFAYSLPGGRL